MGQAKSRGTKDQRVIEGEIKLAQKLAREKKARQEYFDGLSSEERARIKKSRMLLSTMLAFTASCELSS